MATLTKLGDLYAKEGEAVFCERGHQVALIARDMRVGGTLLADHFTDCIDGFRVTDGKDVPRCPVCHGAVAPAFSSGGGALHMAEGLRVRQFHA